ncbi:hypothetical protein PIB30_111706, partial [Stylosanthes scabra]|nr:hypothetical protein [Stylosanthes scabra]
MVRRCPSNVFPEWLHLQTFYDGTLPTSRILLESAANGSLHTKTPEEALGLIELVATDADFQQPYNLGKYTESYQ